MPNRLAAQPRGARIDRRAFLRGVGGAAAGIAAAGTLSACGTGTSRSVGSGGKSSKTLVVRNSGGSYGDANQQAIYEPFTKETGIQVKVVNIEYAQMLAQIKQGRPEFDVIDDSMADFVLFQQEGGTQALDYDRLKNFKKAGVAKNLVTPNAVGKNYWASVMAYRTDAFGGKKPASWADFWDTEAFPGNRAPPGPRRRPARAGIRPPRRRSAPRQALPPRRRPCLQGPRRDQVRTSGSSGTPAHCPACCWAARRSTPPASGTAAWTP
ncbi:extracellular solute-binding protein [Streptomyces purpurascens]